MIRPLFERRRAYKNGKKDYNDNEEQQEDNRESEDGESDSTESYDLNEEVGDESKDFIDDGRIKMAKKTTMTMRSSKKITGKVKMVKVTLLKVMI